MTDPAKITVGDDRRALASVTGIDPASIGHYAMVITTDQGIVIKFCCDDRREAARLLIGGGVIVENERGEPLHPGGPVPAMPEDN